LTFLISVLNFPVTKKLRPGAFNLLYVVARKGVREASVALIIYSQSSLAGVSSFYRTTLCGFFINERRICK
jgi:hypothetical protein